MWSKLFKRIWRWIREFLNDDAEWHAFWVGFFEPWTWIWRSPIPTVYYMNVIEKEFHYYRMGKAIGATLLVATIIMFIMLSIRGYMK